MENNKPFDIAVTFGRFNLPHHGHLDLFRQMANVSNSVSIGLSTNADNLPSDSRAEAIEIMTSDFEVPVFITPRATVFAALDEIDSSNVIFFVGEDQYKLAKAVERVKGWTIATIPRLTSSSALRTLIDNEEWDVLSRLVPAPIFSHVIRLRNQEKQNG